MRIERCALMLGLVLNVHGLAVASLAPGWNSQPPGVAGLYPSLAFRPTTGQPAISYMVSFSTGGYVEFDGGSWQSIPPPFGYDVSSLAFAPNGVAGIVGGGFTHLGRYSELAAGNWSSPVGFYTVDEGAQYPSLAFGLDDEPSVSHFLSCPNGGTLLYSKRSSGSWSTSTVDDGGCSGGYTSLAFHPISGQPCIAYQDVTNGDLRFVCFDGGWGNSEAIDQGGEVGTVISLAFSPITPFYPGISYRDVTNGDLKYAHFDGSNWLTETVDATGDTGFTTSLAFSSSTGFPAIAYHDNTNGALRLAEYNGASWNLETVDDNAHAYASIKFDPVTSQPCIAYTDGAGDLNYVCRVASIPAMSGWGTMIAGVSLLLVGAALQHRRQQTFDAAQEQLRPGGTDGVPLVLSSADSRLNGSLMQRGAAEPLADSRFKPGNASCFGTGQALSVPGLPAATDRERTPCPNLALWNSL